MTPAEYATLSAVDIAAGIRARRFTASAIIDAAFAAIASVEPQLHSFATLAEDQARAAAARIDAAIAVGEDPGPLAGVPVAIKDLVMTAGIRTTFGSRLYADYVPTDDDIVVERLKAAGAIVVGKSNAAEFGFGAHGRNLVFETTRNPWDTSLTPGGSSAGSGAAVAAGLVPIAIGSDGGGSIRIPASFCGLIGMKASMGRVPLWPGCRDETLPGASGWESIEHLGPITRSVADAALMLSVIAGPDGRDRWSIPCADVDWIGAAARPLRRRLKVAYWPNWPGLPIDHRVAAVVDTAVETYAAALGFDLVVTEPPNIAIRTAMDVIVALENDLTGLRRLVAETGVEVTPALQQFLTTRLPLEAATDAVTVRKAWANAMARLMADVDLILTPTLAALPFAADATHPTEIDGLAIGPEDWCPFTYPFNLTGQPAISIPCGFAEDRLPVGIQIVGPHLGDGLVLSVAAAFERLALPGKRPPIHA
ncbi:MAG: amidase [Ancalomicrobiaceae bacterium]|nr:amidase [Ancalomicrobiaceae bacterium]